MLLTSSSVDKPKLGSLLLRRTISPKSTIAQPPLRIAYRIIRPTLLKSDHAPLLFIHGGPSLPSEYLNPIADETPLQDRSLILYDQLGCGWSSIPRENKWYCIENMALDLLELLQHLKKQYDLASYHMCGHSLGGAIGYEVLRHTQDEEYKDNLPRCLSFILSNASTNFDLSESERNRLLKESRHTMNEFIAVHVCRTEKYPEALRLAIGRRGKEWSANNYVAVPLDRNTEQFPSVLIIRGKYDFVTEICTHGWKDLIGKPIQEIVLDGCSHYPHLEKPDDYSKVLQHFCVASESGKLS
ncbi:hypothetical protein ACHAWO_013633 [Cyclotella atomus]|uniref:AB hydrolase-1 domain-containing protein n=1 Tax=Cyclotella atomus TaxID=382360 RepID=A0ABD3PT97_9STRA